MTIPLDSLKINGRKPERTRSWFVLALLLSIPIFGCSHDKIHRSDNVMPVTDEGLRELFVERAERVITLLTEKGVKIPDVRGHEPTAVDLMWLEPISERYRSCRIFWPDFTIDFGIDCELEGVSYNPPDRYSDGPPSEGEKHIDSVSSSTLHRQTFSLLQGLKPLAWQDYDLSWYSEPLPHTNPNSHDFCYVGKMNNLPCDGKTIFISYYAGERSVEVSFEQWIVS